MKPSIVTHSVWLLVTVFTFVLGSQLARPAKTGHGPGAMDAPSGGIPSATSLFLAKSSPDSRTGTADGETGSGTEGGTGSPWESGANPSAPGAATGRRGGQDAPPPGKEQIGELVLRAIKSPDPVERRKAFDQLLQMMQSDTFTEEQAMTMRSAMHESGASGEQWRLFDYAWGANDPATAAAHIDEIAKPYRDGFTGNMLPGLASVDPQTAIDIVAAMGEEQKMRMTGRLLEGLADYDIGFATGYVLELAENGDPSAAQYMKRLAKEVLGTGGFDAGLTWVEGLPEGPLQAAALVRVANEYANSDPLGAAQWAEQYVGTEQNSRLFGEVVREWGDLDAASAWVDSLGESKGQLDALSAVYGFRGAKEPDVAVQEIIAMPTSSDRDYAINGFISGLAHQDGEAAVVWAAEITDPGMRASAQIRAARQFYEQDQRAAAEWFVGSGLPAESWDKVTGSK